MWPSLFLIALNLVTKATLLKKKWTMAHSIPIQVITETYTHKHTHTHIYILHTHVCVCVWLYKNKNMNICISNRSSKTRGEGTADLILIIKDPCCKSEKLHPCLIMLAGSAINNWCSVGKSFKREPQSDRSRSQKQHPGLFPW